MEIIFWFFWLVCVGNATLQFGAEWFDKLLLEPAYTGLLLPSFCGVLLLLYCIVPICFSVVVAVIAAVLLSSTIGATFYQLWRHR